MNFFWFKKEIDQTEISLEYERSLYSKNIEKQRKPEQALASGGGMARLSGNFSGGSMRKLSMAVVLFPTLTRTWTAATAHAFVGALEQRD